MVCVMVWKTSVSRRDCPADCRLGKLKKPGDRGFYRGRTRRRDRTGARRHQHPKPAPQAGAIHGAAAAAAGAAPSLAGPNSERLWTACFQPPRGGRVAGRVPNTRSEACTYILLWFIAEGPLGALSHDSDSDEPQPLLYMDELGAASPELLLALPCMDEPPPLVD